MSPTEIKGVVGSRAGYGPKVQGQEQTAMHKKTGWKTVEQVMLAKKREIEQAFGLVVAKVLERISRG